MIYLNNKLLIVQEVGRQKVIKFITIKDAMEAGDGFLFII